MVDRKHRPEGGAGASAGRRRRPTVDDCPSPPTPFPTTGRKSPADGAARRPCPDRRCTHEPARRELQGRPRDGAFRWPLSVRAHEDPFLPNAVIEELNTALGESLLPSTATFDRERRRFAALVAACSHTLWLSSPAMDMGEDRPLLPSPFLLEVLRAQGLEASYSELERRQVDAGSRSEVLPDPQRALDAAEHRAARLLRDPTNNVGWQATHVLGRRQLERELLRHATESNEWTGEVTAPLPPIPGWNDNGVHAFVLQVLLSSPERYLLRYVFSAFPAKGFPTPPDPFDRRTRQKALIRLFEPQGTIQDAMDAFDVHMAEQFGGEWPPAIRELALQIALRDTRALHEGLPRLAPGPELSGAPVDVDLPWRLSGTLGFEQDECLVNVDLYPPTRDPLDRPALLLQAIATGSPRAQTLAPFAKDGPVLKLADLTQDVLERLHAAHAAVLAGWWVAKVTP